VELRRAIDGKAAKDDATTPAAWRAKVASITAAFDAKLSLVSREATEEAVRATEKRLADVIDAVNKKAYKSDVTAALATRVSVDDFDAAVRRLADASAVQDALRRKANAADVDGVKRALLDVVNAVMVRAAACAFWWWVGRHECRPAATPHLVVLWPVCCACRCPITPPCRRLPPVSAPRYQPRHCSLRMLPASVTRSPTLGPPQAQLPVVLRPCGEEATATQLVSLQI